MPGKVVAGVSIGAGAFVEKVSGGRAGCLTPGEVRERGASGRALIEEMTDAGVFVFGDGGLDASTAVCGVDPGSGSPVAACTWDEQEGSPGQAPSAVFHLDS